MNDITVIDLIVYLIFTLIGMRIGNLMTQWYRDEQIKKQKKLIQTLKQIIGKRSIY
jgi:hypothetical protein